MIWLVLLASAALGATFNGGPYVNAISHSSARIQASTDVTGSSCSIEYGTTGSYGSASTFTCAAPHKAWYLSALAPATLYHYRMCVDGTCTSDDTFTTSALPSPHPALPAAPAAAELTVTGGGSTLTVGSDCDDPSTGLLAQWAAATWGDTIEIPTTTICSGHYVLTAKATDSNVPHRWITIRTAAADSSLPPAGVRITPAYSAQTAKIYNGVPQILYYPSSLLNNMCFPGAFLWAYDLSNFQLYQCSQQATRTVTAASASGDLVLTVSTTGITDGHFVRLTGITGSTSGDGNYIAEIVDSSHLKVKHFLGGAYVQSTGALTTSSGTVAEDKFTIVTYASSASVPGSCSAAGDWFYKTGGTAADSVYRCVSVEGSLRYARVLMRSIGTEQDGSAIDLATNSIHHVRFIGLDISTPPWPLDPLNKQYNGYAQLGIGVGVFFANVFQGPANHHILYDRCLIRGNLDQRSWYGVMNDGANTGIINSYLDGYARWQWYNAPDFYAGPNESTAIVHQYGPGPGLIDNNYIEAYGVSVYWNDDKGPNGAAPADYTVTRNYFARNDAYRLGSPTSNNYYVEVRHLLELKRGQRFMIDGNVFDNTWTNINQGAAVALTPRPGPGAWVSSCTVGGSCSGPYPHLLSPGDVIWFTPNSTNTTLNAGYWTVATTPDALTFTVASYSGGAAGPAYFYATKVASDDGISDVQVSNNYFTRAANGIFTTGHTEYTTMQLPSHARLLVENNIFDQIDGARASSVGGFPSGNGGYMLYASQGVEDFTVRNNTAYAESGPVSNILFSDPAAHEGLSATSNIFWWSSYQITSWNSASSYGSTALDAAWKAGSSPSWSWAGNIMAKSGGDPGGYPAGNTWFDLASTFPFVDATGGDFRVTDAEYAAGAAQVTVWQATGQAALNSVDVGSSIANFTFSAYDGDSCAVQLSTDSWATATTTTWGGSGQRVISAPVTPSTSPAYRFTCRSYSTTGTLTVPAAGSSTSTTITLGGGASSTTISYGATAGLGTTTGASNCTSGCTITIPSVTSRSRLYYQVNYSGVAAGPIQQFIVP